MELNKEGAYSSLESPKKVTKRVLDVDIIFPPSDVEGPIFAERLDKLIRKIGFNKCQKDVIKASLIIAKKRGTEENKFYVPYIKGRKDFYLSLPDDLKDIQETSWLRRSGRTAMAHFLEAAVIALESIPDIKRIDKDVLTKIICIALLHDTVEDSKGLYDYEDLGYDLGWFVMKSFINTNYCRFKIFSFSESHLSTHFNYQYRKIVEDIIEGVKRLTIEGRDENLIDLIFKLAPISIKRKEKFDKYKIEVMEVLSEYEVLHSRFKEDLKKAIKLGNNEFRKVVYHYIMQIRPTEEKILNALNFWTKRLFSQTSFEDINYLDAISILVRLSETITAIGPTDIEGFTKGEYGISNIDMKQAIYLPFLEKVGPLLDKFFGEGTSSKLKEIFNIYLEGAKKIVKVKFDIEKVTYETQEQVSNVLHLNI